MRKISPGTDESRRQNPILAPEGRHLPDHPDTPESPDIPDSKVFEDKSFHIKPAGYPILMPATFTYHLSLKIKKPAFSQGRLLFPYNYL